MIIIPDPQIKTYKNTTLHNHIIRPLKFIIMSKYSSSHNALNKKGKSLC